MASTEDIKIVVTADNKTGKGFSAVTKGLIGITAALAGLVAITKKSIEAFAVQEKAEARLLATTSNYIKTFEKVDETSAEFQKRVQEVNEELKNQARELQKVTTFGDEQIISAQAMASTFALNADQIKKLIPRVLDMGAAMEKSTGSSVDLEQITIAVGKAMTNGIGALSRYGVVISESAEEAFNLADNNEKLNIILGELDKNFGGVAETLAETTTGQMIQFQNAVGDLQEQFGKVMAEALLPFVQTLTQFAQDPKQLKK